MGNAGASFYRLHYVTRPLEPVNMFWFVKVVELPFKPGLVQ